MVIIEDFNHLEHHWKQSQHCKIFRAGLADFHFSRQEKKETGFSRSHPKHLRVLTEKVKEIRKWPCSSYIKIETEAVIHSP